MYGWLARTTYCLTSKSITASENEFAELGGLESDHQRANELHSVVEDLCRIWITAGSPNIDQEDRILAPGEEFRLPYEEHLWLEERAVFPRAAKVLNGQAIAAIGHEFRERRG